MMIECKRCSRSSARPSSVGPLLFLLTALALGLGHPAEAQMPRGGSVPRVRTVSQPVDAAIEVDSACGPSTGCYDVVDDPYWGWACSGRLWCEIDYLLWWTRASDAPPLVVTSLQVAPPTAQDTLGPVPTRVLFGGENLPGGVQPGGRIRLGMWLDPCETAGFEASYLGLADRRASFSATSDDTPVLARPFFNLITNQNDAMLVAHPDFLTGEVRAAVETGWQTVNVAYRQLLWQQCERRFDWLAGYRYASLDDRFQVSQASLYTQPRGDILPGTTKTVSDSFAARNEFHGGELGLVYQDARGRWTGELMLRVGLGGTRSQVDVQGTTVNTVPVPGGPDLTATFVGGLLAQETNMGRHVEDGFSVLPELGVKLGYDITPQLQFTVGYGLFAWSRVMRPLDQLDLRMSQLPPEPPAGARRPQFPSSTSTFWAQGLQFGLAYEF